MLTDTQTNSQIVELHVDVANVLQELAASRYPEFGGRTSVRMSQGEKPMFIFGQMNA